MYTPPKIINLNKPAEDVCERVLSLAMKNLRVPTSSQKLMRFYASCSTGFRASLKAIENATGISTNKVSERRKTLLKSGLMAYSNGTITIDWNLLYDFAALRSYKMGSKQNWNILPDRKKAAYHILHSIPHTEDERQYRTFYAATRQAIIDGIHFPDLTIEEEKIFVNPPLVPNPKMPHWKDENIDNAVANTTINTMYVPTEPLPF